MARSTVEIIRGGGERLKAAGSAAEKLRTIRGLISETEAEIAQLSEERLQYNVAALTGDAKAIAARREIDAGIVTLRQWLDDLRHAEGSLAAALAAAGAADSLAAATAERRELAQARLVFDRLADEIMPAAERLAAVLRESRREALHLAQVSGNRQIARFADRLPEVFRNTLAALFKIDPDGPVRSENNLLGITSEWIGEMARRPFRQIAEEMLDDCLAMFEDEAAASACVARLRLRRTPALALPLVGGLWAVIPQANAFATRREAESGLASVSLFREGHQIVEYLATFLILQNQLAGALMPPAGTAEAA